MVRKLVTFMTAGLLIIIPLAANALGFGAIKLNSALNERFDAEVEVISPTPDDIKSLKVNLASQTAFLRAGIERSALHNSLLFEIKQHTNDAYYIHLSSKGAIREPFLNFLVEMSWKNGRMLREYTVLLDPPSQLRAQQKTQQPAAIETPAMAAPAAVEKAEAEAPVAEPFVPAPVVSAPVSKPVPKTDDIELAEGEKLPRIDLSEYKETDEEIAMQQAAAKQVVEAKPEPAPVKAEPVVESTEKAMTGDMVAESKPFAEDELFPTIPLTTYREGAVVSEMAGEFDYGITNKKDNLWNIAKKMRPSEDVSIYQVMMALVQANPKAFADGNVHRLKVGHVLRIDDPALFTAMSKQQAANEYQLQTREWDEFRQAAAGSVKQQPVIATQVESETAISEPAAKGELTLASPESTDQKAGTGVSEDAISNDLATLKAELAQMREQANAAHGQNEALNSRIRELESQLADMQRTISIKDNELAALQKQLSEINSQQAVTETAPVAETPVVEPSVTEQVAEAEPVAEQPATEMVEEEIKPEQPVAADQPEAVTESPVAIAERIAQQEKAKPAPVEKPVPAKEQGTMDMVKAWLAQAGNVASDIGAAIGGVLGGGMTMYIVIGVVVFILFASLIVIKRRKQGENFQESILKGTPSAAPSGSDVPSADLATSEESSFLSDFAVSGAGAIQTEDSEVDPLTEADVFMAYGRYEAAEERLQEAIQAEPDREELKLKLLDLYNTTKNSTAFETTAEDIYASLAGNTAGNPTWDKVVTMGKQLLPDNPLFSSDTSTVEADAAAPAVEAAGAELTDSQVMDIGLETGTFNADDISKAELTSESPATETDDLDFNLDFDQPPAAEEDSASMDFDLDLGEAATQTTDESGSMDFDLGEPAAELTEDSGTMDFDLDLGEQAAEATAGDTGLDFNLDMETSASDEQTLTSVEEPDSTMMMDIGEDLDLTSPATGDSAAMDLGLDASDAADFDMPVEGDEVGTKLDLAKAYIDMGDPEGARSILDEVLEEGDEQQKAEAQQLMQQIA